VKKDYKNGCYEADFSCSSVTKGVRKKDGSIVLIKRWRADDIRAKREISASDKIQNEAVKPFTDIFSEGGLIYAVREWIDAVSLHELILKKKRLTVPQALDIMIKICMVMKDIYDENGSFVHADIRPANFLYDTVSKKVWFIDLETFTFFDNQKDKKITGLLTLGGYTVSPEVEGFCAPEVFCGEICVQSDVFSLGKLFGFLIGMCGFDGSFINPGKDDFHKDAAEIIRKCTCSDSENRYGHAGFLLDALCELFNSVTTEKYMQITSVPAYGNKNVGTDTTHKKKIIYVGGNSCFASELSYVLAQKKRLKTLLVGNETFHGVGAFDYFIDMHGSTDISLVSEKPTPFFCDCSHLYLTDEKQWTLRGILSNSRAENLYVSDCDIFTEFDIRDREGLDDFFKWSDKYFDITVVCDSSDNAESISGEIMIASDCVIVPVRPNIDEVYKSYKQYRQTALRFGFPQTRIMFVAWEYDEGISMPIDDFEIAVDGLYGGYVPYDAERLKCKNINGDFYCERYSEKLFLIYTDLAERITAL